MMFVPTETGSYDAVRSYFFKDQKIILTVMTLWISQLCLFCWNILWATRKRLTCLWMS